MSAIKDPSAEKAAVLQLVEMTLGPTMQIASRRPDWRVSTNDKTSVFITFSKDDDLFYDVSVADIDAWSSYVRAFIVFGMGGADDVLIVPLHILKDKILQRMKPKERGNFKLHITGSGRLCFKEARHFAVDDYRNAFELLKEDTSVAPAV